MVSTEYMDENERIKSYGKDQDIQYLSESIGQYMAYLLLLEDHDEFKRQVEVLAENFLVTKEKQLFIKWQLTEGTETNASVDDLRIIEALYEGGELFHESSYIELADKLLQTLEKTQAVNGLLVDFYDWELDKATSTMHLSYINSNVLQRLASFNIEAYQQIVEGAVDAPFFYERYDVEKQEYQAADTKTVNLIDQFLIAIQYWEITGKVPSVFDEWVKQELDSKGKLFGVYQKGSLEPAVTYESSAVYALGVIYFLKTDDQSYADLFHQLLLKQPPFEMKPDYTTIHFFDYIYARSADELYK